MIYKQFPKNFTAFMNLINNNINFKYYYNKLKIMQPFDVSLRDGIQNINFMSLNQKLNHYNFIKTNHSPSHIEIGSIVSKKKLPIFSNTNKLIEEISTSDTDYFILFPNLIKLEDYLDKNFGKHSYSFISSISNTFQLKNINRTLEQSDEEIISMIKLVKSNHKDAKIKLYLSCINECPFEGKKTVNCIIDKIDYFLKQPIDFIMLSDTCGSLTTDFFLTLLKKIDTYKYDISKIGMHFHVKDEKQTEELFILSLNYGIRIFDVSEISNGGCSLTLNKKERHANLSYEQFYKFVLRYLIIYDNTIKNRRLKGLRSKYI
jgi:hydroxymethylglutaryl-CoA lyase